MLLSMFVILSLYDELNCVERKRNLNSIIDVLPWPVKWHGCWMLDQHLPNQMWAPDDSCEKYFIVRKLQYGNLHGKKKVPCKLFSKNNSKMCREDWTMYVC